MDATLQLLPSTYQPAAPVRKAPRNTVIEDAPQVSLRRAAPPRMAKGSLKITSPMSDDFPTPKGNTSYAPIQEDIEAPSPSSSDTTSERSSLWSKRSSQSDFDELYDLTESESEKEEVPIKLSSSIKKRMGGGRTRYPSIVIPSPSAWPTIEKLQKSAATPLSPALKVAISSAALSQLNARTLQVPSRAATPSLDGSLTSEELASMSSCPSTPDMQNRVVDANEWYPPMQLDPATISILQHLNPEAEHEPLQTVIEVPEEAMQEMREIVQSPGINIRINTATEDLTKGDAAEEADQLSALSVPSPGGFFSSLDSSLARHTWAGTEPTPTTGTAVEFYGVPFRAGLPTSTAQAFYNVPWQARPENPVEHTVALASPKSEYDPVTARKAVFSPTETIIEVAEIDENYESVLQETASANIDRTQLWLSAQTSYLEAICEEKEVVDCFRDVVGAVPSTPEQASPVSASTTSPSKKSVRFVETAGIATPQAAASPRRVSPIHDGTFWEAHQHMIRSRRARDVFAHRQARAEAVHVERASCSKKYVDQLKGQFEITDTLRPSPARPISTFLPAAADDDRKELIAQAERERQALEQLQPSAWHLAAMKELNGGRILTSPAAESLQSTNEGRVLDLAGQVHGSWSWQVAYSFPSASVFTTVSSDVEAHVASSSIAGPDNQTILAAPRLWQLPFPADHFDVISARSLYAHLKNAVPKAEVADEWDLTLAECQRILKPGGYLEFDVLDAELVQPGPAGQALGVEFAFNLKTRGYDASASKSFLSRLRKAGFEEVKRCWTILPVSDVVPKWTDIGKTPSSTCTITPGTSKSDYFGPDAVERIIGPNGSVAMFEKYEPPVTGSTRDVKAITGLAGARMWEQWMLKLNVEMGRSEQRCLEGVAKALEEGGKGKAGWRCLVGWARKAE